MVQESRATIAVRASVLPTFHLDAAADPSAPRLTSNTAGLSYDLVVERPTAGGHARTGRLPAGALLPSDTLLVLVVPD
jgi:hypothetical protein